MYQNFQTLRIASLISSPGHHNWFLTDKGCQNVILRDVRFIRENGFSDYLRKEYPLPQRKQIILNIINGRFYIVDGNRHLCSLLIAIPDFTLGQLVFCNPAYLRVWKRGYESPAQQTPFEIYIPDRINTDKLDSVKTGIDYFKTPCQKTKILRADIPFDSNAFCSADRGRPLYETALAFTQKYLSCVT